VVAGEGLRSVLNASSSKLLDQETPFKNARYRKVLGFFYFGRLLSSKVQLISCNSIA
jgi:hypothetical protein